MAMIAGFPNTVPSYQLGGSSMVASDCFSPLYSVSIVPLGAETVLCFMVTVIVLSVWSFVSLSQTAPQLSFILNVNVYTPASVSVHLPSAELIVTLPVMSLTLFATSL